MNHKFVFSFKATECNGWPKIRVKINNHIVKNHHFSTSQAEIELILDLGPGQHLVEIERYGKTDSNVDYRDNTILKDQTVELVDIVFEDVRLPKWFLYQATWIWEHNKKEEKGSLLWGPNGTWKWSLETPFIPWAISAMRSHSINHADLLDPLHPVDRDKTAKALENLEKLEHIIVKQKN